MEKKDKKTLLPVNTAKTVRTIAVIALLAVIVFLAVKGISSSGNTVSVLPLFL